MICIIKDGQFIDLPATTGGTIEQPRHEIGIEGPKPYGLYKIPIVVIAYYPLCENDWINPKVTGDVTGTLTEFRSYVDSLTTQAINTLEQASKYKGWANPNATINMSYHIVAWFEVFEPYPLSSRFPKKPPLVDYGAICNRFNIPDLVDSYGVKQIWAFGYHGNKVTLWESTMRSPWGNISNSGRYDEELPPASQSYTLYNYNYGRGLGEILEDHIHQMEHVLNWVDGRDATPEGDWASLMFWGNFVGSNFSHLITSPGCGWAEVPPNGRGSYDWGNTAPVETDMFDWRPQRDGQRTTVTCADWGCSGIGWKSLWPQFLPGDGHSLSWNGAPLPNWWRFFGDFDGAISEGVALA